MPRRTRYAGQDPSTPGGLVEHALKNVWGGRQHAMAMDLGVSQALISKVVRGEQGPGEKLYSALVKDPRVGHDPSMGLPAGFRFSEGEVTPPDSLSLPISRVILPGLVEQHAGLLTGMQIRVGSLFRPTMYILEIQKGDPVTRVPELKVAPRDLLVMETDRETWEGNLRVLVGKLVAVRVEGNGLPDYLLAKVVAEHDEGVLKLQVPLPLKPAARAPRTGSEILKARGPGAMPSEGGGPEVRARVFGAPAGVSVDVEDILAQCILSIRF